MRASAGLTLIEVVVAGSLLVTGILALVTLQAKALQIQRRVRVVRELVAIAENELQRRLALPAAASTVSEQCAASVVNLQASCEVTMLPCTRSSSGCGQGGADDLVRIVVTVEGQGGEEFSLGAFHSRFPVLP